ncbi:MAG: SDR family oxidoreductase [Acidimicrobiales bacterium]|nr:SDR family oxidoreductase [Acidimicrobiales bacterium]
MVDAAVAEHGRIHVLVNNAGISDLRGLASEHFDTETFRRVVDVDLMGVWHYTRAVGRHLLAEGGGSIINIASILAEGGNEFVTPACQAAKAAVPPIGEQYEGLAPLPREEWKLGVPGIHYDPQAQ